MQNFCTTRCPLWRQSWKLFTGPHLDFIYWLLSEGMPPPLHRQSNASTRLTRNSSHRPVLLLLLALRLLLFAAVWQQKMRGFLRCKVVHLHRQTNHTTTPSLSSRVHTQDDAVRPRWSRTQLFQRRRSHTARYRPSSAAEVELVQH